MYPRLYNLTVFLETVLFSSLVKEISGRRNRQNSKLNEVYFARTLALDTEHFKFDVYIHPKREIFENESEFLGSKSCYLNKCLQSGL